MAYTGFTIFCVLLYLLSNAVSQRQNRKSMAKIKEELMIANIYNDLLDLESEYLRVKESGALEGFPCVQDYLNDVSKFLDNANNKITLKGVYLTRHDPTGATSLQDLINEIEACPPSVKTLIARKKDVLMRVALLKHKGTAYILCNEAATKFDVSLVLIKLSLEIALYKAAFAISNSAAKLLNPILLEEKQIDKQIISDGAKLAEVM